MYPDSEEENFHPPSDEYDSSNKEYVAIRHCSYKSVYASPGDPIPDEFPEEAIEVLLKKGAIELTES